MQAWLHMKSDASNKNQRPGRSQAVQGPKAHRNPQGHQLQGKALQLPIGSSKAMLWFPAVHDHHRHISTCWFPLLQWYDTCIGSCARKEKRRLKTTPCGINLWEAKYHTGLPREVHVMRAGSAAHPTSVSVFSHGRVSFYKISSCFTLWAMQVNVEKPRSWSAGNQSWASGLGTPSHMPVHSAGRRLVQLIQVLLIDH